MTTLNIPKDFIYNDLAAIKAKVNHFINEGPDKLHVVFDFDRTLTMAHPESNEDITTWHILKEHLPSSGKARYQELFNHYRTLEMQQQMSQDQAREWWSSILDLFVEYKIDMRVVENDFLSKATIRPQTKELFDVCNKAGIPTIVMSAGVKDVIDIWARSYRISPTIILSTSLRLDTDGTLVDWDKYSLIHTLNKKELAHPELARIRSVRPMALLVGDSIHDADMAEGMQDVFRIYINDPRTDEKIIKALSRNKAFEKFDVVIETGSLGSAKELIEMIGK